MLETREINGYIFLITDKCGVVNTTPHSIRFMSDTGDIIELEPTKEALLNASVEEKPIMNDLVTTIFKPSEEGWKIIEEIERIWADHPEFNGKNLRIVGSIIACQAYPGRCVGMVPCPGYERVAPAEKRMRLDKFNVYLK